MNIISVGIPFYNPGPDFEYAIRSVLNQSYSNFELILLDDGSTDCSIEIVKKFNDNRIKLISDGENKGLPYRLNQLIDLSEGEYLARMDADDIMHSKRLEVQLDSLLNNNNIDVVCSGVASLSADNLIQGVRLMEPLKKDIGRVSCLIGHSGICHPSILARKTWFLRNRYNVTNSRAEDAELWFNALINNDLKIDKIQLPLHLYREGSSVKYKNLVRSYRTQIQMLNDYEKQLEFFNKSTAIFKTRLKLFVVYILKNLGLLSILTRQKRNQPWDKFDLELNSSLKAAIKGKGK